MFGPDFPQQLKQRLKASLPGWSAQQEMIPEGRLQLETPHGFQSASVLIALHHSKDGWCFPLIKRSIDGFAHSGQIALPGGRAEGDETIVETALREAWEEVNIRPETVKILGQLTPLPIPVSHHLVQPVIGELTATPNLIPDPKEVAGVFNVSIQDLIALEIQTERREFKNRAWDIPYLEMSGHRVWGATAMILSEFRAILGNLEGSKAL